MTEDEQDELKRTTALGLFNVAKLYLKAFLRHHGHTLKELRGKKFGHSTAALENRASQLGLFFEDEDEAILLLMANTDTVIRSRYVQTGYFQWPDPKGLDRTCKSLQQSVGEVLKKDGVPVRL